MLSVHVDTVRIFLHVLAATVWVGGQLTLAGLVPALRAAGGDVPRSAARAFARIAWPAYAVLIATGIWNITAYDRDDSAYRTTLYVKLAVVLLSGLAAFLHGRATTKAANAVFGALTALFALLALFLGILLGH